ncbi:MAG: alpha/beta fold hydrolase, partial [Mariprofundales bacterium]|nr:alpha/beta fold hydrolase [Mariprofundales bacterium]
LEWLIPQLPPRPTHLIGWSLGAMLALQLAHRLPTQIERLTLYAATPSFCCRSGWRHGITQNRLQEIANSVRGESLKQGLARFTRLMLHGEIKERSLLRQLSAHYLSTTHLPTANGLEAGITLLRTLDLRPLLTTITQPTTLIHGSSDAIIPIAAGQWLAKQLPQAESEWLDGYGHMPWKKQKMMPLLSTRQ